MIRQVLIVMFMVTVLCGCMLGGSSGQPTTRLATDIDPATTQPSYWLEQPGAAVVAYGDFNALWSACERVILSNNFRIDRQEPRRGMLSSEPVLSRQFFELWRIDGPTMHDVAETATSKIRRTIYFCFATTDHRHFTVTPKVLVERFAAVERKLRSSIDYDPTYWYPIRRDTEMEKMLAKSIEAQLRRE